MEAAPTKPRVGRPPDRSRAKRVRVARAYAELCADVGPGDATILGLTVRAHISKATFYNLFGALTACRRLAVEAFVEDIEAALGEPDEGALDRLLEALAADPALTELGLLTGGDDSAGERLGELLREAVDGAPPRKTRSRALRAGEAAAVGLIATEVARGRTAALPELASRIRYLLLLPRMGREQAAAAIELDPDVAAAR